MVGLLAGMFAVTRNPSGCRTIRIDVKRHERRGFIDRVGVSRRVSGTGEAGKKQTRDTDSKELMKRKRQDDRNMKEKV